MTEFTPGPWRSDTVIQRAQIKIFHDSNKPGAISSPLAVAVARLSWTHEARANADLIAAAPELYEALEMVRDADEDCKKDCLPTIPPAARRKIDAALAKARGKKQ